MDHPVHDDSSLRAASEAYFDTVPRSSARAEGFGPLTLFVPEGEGGGWPRFARPAPGSRITSGDVSRVRARQRELGVPERFEWVAETAPALRAAAREAGLAVQEYPLMALAPGEAPTAVPELADGVRIRVLGAGDGELPGALAVPGLVFGPPPAADGRALDERTVSAAETERVKADGTLSRTEDRIRAGLLGVAAAVTADGQVLCSGQHLPSAGATEIVGVATLPSARRRGLGFAVTAALIADARTKGAALVVLSAADESVAGLYGRLGFRRIGMMLVAEPPRTAGAAASGG
ncbi:GNAT family N-acetyltransferase [Streptomyces qinzhouensis]|uniref:GNAT family N-acetyltransferase n=1 Tax=Streptomyces qinzhouensis TaxID=2599401 RepID=A0A5B8JQD1_9ACTN|nr:GNAT family N-acetyltransferase [Streptomyces qinzhouensis]QDY80110.1 GNAT family N-acetyltransferase [Streptomyces qinzhouensis]